MGTLGLAGIVVRSQSGRQRRAGACPTFACSAGSHNGKLTARRQPTDYESGGLYVLAPVSGGPTRSLPVDRLADAGGKLFQRERLDEQQGIRIDHAIMDDGVARVAGRV
jgi:hypothetical protein